MERKADTIMSNCLKLALWNKIYKKKITAVTNNKSHTFKPLGISCNLTRKALMKKVDW